MLTMNAFTNFQGLHTRKILRKTNHGKSVRNGESYMQDKDHSQIMKSRAFVIYLDHRNTRLDLAEKRFR